MKKIHLRRPFATPLGKWAVISEDRANCMSVWANETTPISKPIVRAVLEAADPLPLVTETPSLVTCARCLKVLATRASLVMP